ncbi:MAG: hypothetical protein ACLQOZ_15605 [Acidimicrobiales bacterium]
MTVDDVRTPCPFGGFMARPSSAVPSSTSNDLEAAVDLVEGVCRRVGLVEASNERHPALVAR